MRIDEGRGPRNDTMANEHFGIEHTTDEDRAYADVARRQERSRDRDTRARTKGATMTM